MNEPLDQQYRLIFNKTTQKEEKIPAIDKFFKTERQFLNYKSPPLSILNPKSFDYQACLEEYEERLKLIEQDLKWLLALPYQKFWCQVLFDTSCQNLIDSYLKLSPRPYDFFKIELPVNILNYFSSIHKYIFFVCLRMSTYKESKDNFMNQDAFSDLIYNNFLFDIPKILDLCVLYKNNPILEKLIENLFNSQKKYFNDFKLCIKDIVKALETSKNKLRKIFELDSVYSLNQNNSKKDSNFNNIKNNLKEILEIFYYLTDFVQTLSDLISVQPNLSKYLYEQKFEFNIKDLIESTLFDIEDIITQIKKQADKNYTEIAIVRKKLNPLKYQLAKMFNIILVNSIVNPIIESIDSSKSNQQIQYLIDNYVKICCDILEDKRFLCYYEERFNLSEQIEMVYQISENKMDKSQYDYMIENLRLSILEYSNKTSLRAKFDPSIDNKPVKTVASMSSSQIASSSVPGTSASFNSEDKSVQSVLDLFPEMDKEYIKKCLKYFNNNPEQVINALLENNLPEFSVEEKIENELLLSELSSRKNVFDNDEFDIFNKDKIDTSKIHIGKKSKTDNFDLDNKDDIRRNYLDGYEFNEDDEYEDEYDDTYDANMNVNDVNEEDVGFLFKPLNKKMEIKKRDLFEMDSDEEESEDEEEEEKDKQSQSNQPQTSYQANKTGYVQSNDNNKGQFNNNRNRNRNEPRNQPQQQKFQPKGKFTDNSSQKFNPQNQSRNYQEQGTQKREYNRSELVNVTENQDNRPKNERPMPQRQTQNRPYFDRRQQQRVSGQNIPKQDLEYDNNQQNQEQTEEKAKTYDEIKRDRRWKNDNKSTIAHHNRKYLSAKKTGFL